MGLFDFLKHKKKEYLRVVAKAGVTINGKSASTVIFDQKVDTSSVTGSFKERDVLEDYEIKHYSFRSLDDAKGRKKKYEDILKRERKNGFAIKGGSNLYKMTNEDKLAIKEFDVLIKPILKEVKFKSLDDSINAIASLYRSFNKKNSSQISFGYTRWYFEYATIIFDIEHQFKKK